MVMTKTMHWTDIHAIPSIHRVLLWTKEFPHEAVRSMALRAGFSRLRHGGDGAATSAGALPLEGRHDDGSLPGGRRQRLHRAGPERPGRQGARRAGDRREPRWRERRHRRGQGAGGAGRRPLPVPGLAQRADPVGAGQQEHALQARGLPVDRAGGHLAAGADGQQPAAGALAR
ncbi:hypothetical protein D3C85_1028600 [compost metagenome]